MIWEVLFLLLSSLFVFSWLQMTRLFFQWMQELLSANLRGSPVTLVNLSPPPFFLKPRSWIKYIRQGKINSLNVLGFMKWDSELWLVARLDPHFLYEEALPSRNKQTGEVIYFQEWRSHLVSTGLVSLGVSLESSWLNFQDAGFDLQGWAGPYLKASLLLWLLIGNTKMLHREKREREKT